MGTRPSTLDKGFAGEQAMGFFLGERGYFFVDGPSGAAGHAANARGFDGVAFNPKTGNLIIYDNKAWKRSGNVGSASAIDNQDNARLLKHNLTGMIARVRTMNDMPNQEEILDLLEQTRTAVGTGAPWPAKVDIAVSNAWGNLTGIGPELSRFGIRFIDFNEAPTPVRRVLTDQQIGAFLGLALGAFLQWLGDLGIQREVDRRLKTELAPQIQSILERGDGVLIVISLEETEQEDNNGKRARLLLAVYVHGGKTESEARASWENTPRLLRGPAKGWRTVTQYGWIPPLN
jgi:hypothetical protein